MHSLIVVGLVMLISVGWSIANHRRAPYRCSDTGGTITPGKWSAAIVVTIAVALFAAGAVTLGRDGDGATGSGLMMVGAALVLFMGGSLSHAHDLTWTDAMIEGPSRLFGPGLARSRASMHWREIARAGKTITGYWYIQSYDGRRIYWSFLYPGYGQFVDRLRARRPDVTLPGDLA